MSTVSACSRRGHDPYQKGKHDDTRGVSALRSPDIRQIDMFEDARGCFPFLNEADKAIRGGVSLAEEPPSNKTGELATCRKRKISIQATFERW